MKIINATVNDENIIINQADNILENQINDAKISCDFDSTWDKYAKYIIFEDEDSNRFRVALINNEALIPSELKNGFIRFQIYGQVVKENTIENRHPSKVSCFKLINSLSPDGLDVSIPSPTEWDNYIKQIESITDRIVSDEATRVENENARVSAEEQRIKNENARVSAEEDRISAESARVKNETIRTNNEKSRVSSEGKRVLSEKQRIEAENTRIDNEKQRVSSETVRIKNEETREEYILQLKQDVKDGKFNGEANLAVFKVDVKTGKLLMLKTKNLKLIDFRINEKGRLEELLKWIIQ